MRRLIIASLAAMVLASAAQAQSDWVVVSCDYVWAVSDNGTRRESAEQSLYRFNADGIERWVAESLSWYPECDAAVGGFTQANCSISQSQASTSRLAEQDGEVVRRDSFAINRMTGAYSGSFWFSYGVSGAASGSCRPAEDPSAGLRPRF